MTIYEFEHQIIPRAEDQDLYWDSYVFEIPDAYELTEEPYRVEVRAWNEDDCYYHTITAGVALQPIEEVTTMGLLERLLHLWTGE